MSLKNFDMEVKSFGDKKIITKTLSEKDFSKARYFKDFINSLVEEKAPILINKKKSLKEEREWLKAKLKGVKEKKTVFLVSWHNKKIIAETEIYLLEERKEHVGILSIAIRKDYRGMGLGTYLTEKIFKLAKTRLKPIPKIIRLSLSQTNKIAMKLYKDLGFKQVARVSHQYQFNGNLIDELIMILEF